MEWVPSIYSTVLLPIRFIAAQWCATATRDDGADNTQSSPAALHRESPLRNGSRTTEQVMEIPMKYNVHFLRVWEERFAIEVDCKTLPAAKRKAKAVEEHRSTNWNDMEETMTRIHFVDDEAGNELYDIDADPRAAATLHELAELLASHLNALKATPSASRKQHASLIRRSVHALKRVRR
jgi:hypothetical protein